MQHYKIVVYLCSLLYPQHLEKYLSPNKNLINKSESLRQNTKKKKKICPKVAQNCINIIILIPE